MATTNISSTGLKFPDGTKQTTASNSLKNRIINGAMNINQRKKTIDPYWGSLTPQTGGSGYYQANDGSYSPSGTPSASEYWTLDRWNGYVAGYFGVSVRQILKDNSSLQIPNYKYQLSCIASGQTGGHFFLSQKIESIYTQDLVNKTVTLQAHLSGNTVNSQKCCFQVWAISSSPVIGGSPLNGSPIRDYWGTNYINTGTVIYPASGPYYSYLNNATLLKQGFWSITSTPTTYAESFQMPNNENIKNGIMVAFWPYVAANTANVQPWAAGVDLSGSEFRITGVQLELGDQATSFDYRPVSVEQELCERYTYSVNNWSEPNDYYGSPYMSDNNGGSMYSPFTHFDSGYYTYVPAISKYMPTNPGMQIRVVPKVPMFKNPLFDLSGENALAYGARAFKQFVYRANTYGQPIHESLTQYRMPDNGQTYTTSYSWGAYLWNYLSNVSAPETGTSNAYVSFSSISSNAASRLAYTSNTDLEMITLNSSTVNRQGTNGTNSGTGTTYLWNQLYNLPTHRSVFYNYAGYESYNFRMGSPGDLSYSLVTEII